MKSRTVKANRGKSSKVYDSKGRLARQVVDGSPIDYEYTKYGQLAGKYLGGRQNADASVVYEYSKSGQIVARTANGVRQTYEYDKKGQLLAVKDSDGNALERYAYDKAGNMLKKTLRIGRGDSPSRPQYQTTTFTFDDANQLVSSTTDGVTTRYAYDAAGRMVREGNKTYRYGYLDKVLSVTDGDTTRTFTYHADGQLASATVGSALRADRGATPLSEPETFQWDGLALIQRGDEQFVNEPHIGGGNPVASSKGTSYFNDALGTTVGSMSNGKYSAAALTAFGENVSVDSPTPTQNSNFFTGKPYVEGLGHAFWMRNYRAGLAKWQTADPMGYPDGWNQLAYCGNGVTSGVDLWGCKKEKIVNFDTEQQFFVTIPWFNSEWDGFGRMKQLAEEAKKAGKELKKYVDEKLAEWRRDKTTEALADSLLYELVKYFAEQQGADYSESTPNEWDAILEQNEADGWELVYGPKHLGISIDYDTDVINAGPGALIIEGCTHHWEAKFEKE